LLGVLCVNFFDIMVQIFMREMKITNNGKPTVLLTPLYDKTLEDTVPTVRKAKAINAMKKMHEISVFLGNDKMTLEKINSIIQDVKMYRGRK